MQPTPSHSTAAHHHVAPSTQRVRGQPALRTGSMSPPATAPGPPHLPQAHALGDVVRLHEGLQRGDVQHLLERILRPPCAPPCIHRARLRSSLHPPRPPRAPHCIHRARLRSSLHPPRPPCARAHPHGPHHVGRHHESAAHRCNVTPRRQGAQAHLASHSSRSDSNAVAGLLTPTDENTRQVTWARCHVRESHLPDAPTARQRSPGR